MNTGVRCSLNLECHKLLSRLSGQFEQNLIARVSQSLDGLLGGETSESLDLETPETGRVRGRVRRIAVLTHEDGTGRTRV